MVRPGGRISLVETCHAQSRIDGDDTLAAAAVAGVANPTAGLGLRALLLGAGCRDVVAHARPLVFTSIDSLYPVVRLKVLARAAARQHPPEMVDAALAEMDRRDREGTFFACMVFYVAAGTVSGEDDLVG